MKIIIIYILAGLLMAGSIYGIFIYSSTKPLETDLLATINEPVEKPECPSCDCPTCPEPEPCEPIIKEVEVIKEVIKEVPVIKEVIKEVPVEKIVYQEVPQECPTCPTCPNCPTCPVCSTLEEDSTPEVVEGNITMSNPASNQILFTAIDEPFEFEYLIIKYTDGISPISLFINNGKRKELIGHQCPHPFKAPPECQSTEYWAFWNKEYYSVGQQYFSTINHFILQPNDEALFMWENIELISIKFKGLNSGKIIEF